MQATQNDPSLDAQVQVEMFDTVFGHWLVLFIGRLGIEPYYIKPSIKSRLKAKAKRQAAAAAKRN